MTTQELREKDIAVLQAIQQGASNTTEIREQTTLSNREINYSINEKSLEQLGLIEVTRPKGREQGTWKPKTLSLTDQGLQYLTEQETDHPYENMTREELIQQVQELENRLDRLENMFKNFRNKVMDRL